MKMNFNFNFNIEDSPAPPNQSIRRITTAYDQDHTVEFRPRNASGCREGIRLFDVNKPSMSSGQERFNPDLSHAWGIQDAMPSTLAKEKGRDLRRSLAPSACVNLRLIG
jgi:hypothetical protein